MTERVKVRMIARNKEKKKGKKGTKNGDRGKKKLTQFVRECGQLSVKIFC